MCLMSHHRISQRLACALLRHPRSTHHYRSVKDPQWALRQRRREIAQVRVRYGYRRIHVLLRRQGWQHSRGKTYRLYTEAWLQLRTKLPKPRNMVMTSAARLLPIPSLPTKNALPPSARNLRVRRARSGPRAAA